MVEAIFKRASVRAFTDEAVTDDQVRAALRAAMAAPSGGNQQPWEFFVVRDAERRSRLSQVTKYAKPAAAAPCAIVACMRTEGLRFPHLVVQDMGAAVENLLLAVADMDLGAVWMGIAPDEEPMKAVADIVGAPEGMQPFAIVALGHPATQPVAKGAERYEESRVHWLG